DLLIGGAVVIVLLLIVGVFLVSRSDSKSSSGGNRATSLPADMLQLGIQYQQDGKLEEAKKAYNAVLLTDPKNKFALYNLGLVAQIQGDNNGAVSYYDRALATDPKMDTAIYNRALALRDLGRLDEAVVALRALLQQGESVGVLQNLGNILIAQGKATEGAALVARANALQKSGAGN
ncbi:MAG: tetratricopeptide repeat protein, partial [Acidimicrobiia bacterium]|nr:tetratricopeptide repeat protein [Acidimicrobiia bacterium]